MVAEDDERRKKALSATPTAAALSADEYLGPLLHVVRNNKQQKTEKNGVGAYLKDALILLLENKPENAVEFMAE